MRTLARSAERASRPEAGGAYLPPVFTPMESKGIRARLGTTTMVAGPPGAFKSGMVLYYLLRLNLPTLYFSADAEDFETVENAAAVVAGVSKGSVAQSYATYQETLQQFDAIRFSYDDSPTYDAVVEETAAYAEAFGDFPKIIVIDNLMNLTGENENEWGGMRDSARVIHKLARITGAAIFVLHHMADDRIDPTTPASRSKVQGKVGQLPKAIWSLALADNRLLVAPVKNRWGPGDASGNTYAELYVSPVNGRIYNSLFDMREDRPA